MQCKEYTETKQGNTAVKEGEKERNADNSKFIQSILLNAMPLLGS